MASLDTFTKGLMDVDLDKVTKMDIGKENSGYTPKVVMNLKVFQLNPLMDMNKQDVMSVIMFVVQMFNRICWCSDGWSTVLTELVQV